MTLADSNKCDNLCHIFPVGLLCLQKKTTISEDFFDTKGIII